MTWHWCRSWGQGASEGAADSPSCPESPSVISYIKAPPSHFTATQYWLFNIKNKFNSKILIYTVIDYLKYDTGLRTERSERPSFVSSRVKHMQGRGTASSRRSTVLKRHSFRWSAMLAMSANFQSFTVLKDVLKRHTWREAEVQKAAVSARAPVRPPRMSYYMGAPTYSAQKILFKGSSC